MIARRAFLEHIDLAGIADGSISFAISSFIYLMFRFAFCGWRWSGSFGSYMGRLYIRNFQE